ncbi:hypothetical protein [Acinetobacter bereziniae]|uniref:hypothetical protein n=1 Tax=Acinetobacter bereziniae TaxID=106648 RepID=UPI00124F7CE2|nr:hypothetical protein [Acinetobacter bereziniae]MBJ9901176.1 hypothetical protein [Acinetobacter bereziniae]MCU4319169.1 hypothetical protein [Acinetobacter bereziniae]MCU4597268.1 hypothetical protein [Acinetobacter bereziniae]
MNKFLLYIVLFFPIIANANDYFKIKYYEAYCLGLSDSAQTLALKAFPKMSDYYNLKETNPMRAQQEKEAAYSSFFSSIISEDPNLDSEKLADILHLINIIYESKQYAFTMVIEKAYKDCLEKYLLDKPYPSAE